MRIAPLMEGAINCVKRYFNVQPGENVLILTDTSGFADPLVVEALAAVAVEGGADVTVVTCKEFEPREEEPPDIVKNAILAANIVFFISPHEALLHSRTGRIAWYEYGVRLCAIVSNTAELMSTEWATFPPEICFAIARKLADAVRDAQVIRVVSPNGTDISSALQPIRLGGYPAADEKATPGPPPPGFGTHSFFPPGTFGIGPHHPTNGTIVYDCLLGCRGRLKEKVRLTVENEYVTKVEGGEEARWFDALIKEKKRQGIVDADRMSEIMWGLNPKASIERGLGQIHLRESELTRRAGTLHFGIGIGFGFHWDGVLLPPFSIFVDDKAIMENGRLKALDDPDVRAVAQKCGDPDKLLSEVP